MTNLFPIVRTINEHGRDYVKKLNRGDIVRCRYCGKKITLNKGTVHMGKDGMQMVWCPNKECNRDVAVLYYFDRVVNGDRLRGRPRNRLTPKRIQVI